MPGMEFINSFMFILTSFMFSNKKFCITEILFANFKTVS